eukprot:PhM_4_TR19065/c1_g1_i1/m.17121
MFSKNLAMVVVASFLMYMIALTPTLVTASDGACPTVVPAAEVVVSRAADGSVIIATPMLCAIFDTTNPRLSVLAHKKTTSSSSSSSAGYGKNTLSAAGITLEREVKGGAVFSSSGATSCSSTTLKIDVDQSKGPTEVTVTIAGVQETCGNPMASETWTLYTNSTTNAVVLSISGQTTRPDNKLVAIRHGVYLAATSVYGFFDAGVMQMKGAGGGANFYATHSPPQLIYAVGGSGDTLHSRGDVSLAMIRNDFYTSEFASDLVLLLSSDNGTPYWSGVQDVMIGNFNTTETWCVGWSGQPGVSGTVEQGITWHVGYVLVANDRDFPLLDINDDGNSQLPLDDLHAILTGIYASPAGNLFTMPNAVEPNTHVSQIATTIHRPDVGYSGTYNYFDPDNYLSTWALLISGSDYLHEQVRGVLARSGAFLNAKGQLPHHFTGTTPTYQALSGETQTGPNVFWILSFLNYVKYSGRLDQLESYMPILRNASTFLFDLYDEDMKLIKAPGSLYIDVFIRGNFTSDSNAMIVGFFEEFADAEEVLGNVTGAEKLRNMSRDMRVAMNEHLFRGDHFITQLNPDGTTRDFVDYDANLIAVAHGVPNSTERTMAILNRVDRGRCTHGRATFVSEDYYGPEDCTNGNIGDSWCAMGRNGLFDALARSYVGDVGTFENVLYEPLANDLREYTWQHERYGCDGKMQLNRTAMYFEYPSVTAVMASYIKYGIRPTLSGFELKPLSAAQSFTYNIGNIFVSYTTRKVQLRLPCLYSSKQTRSMVIHGLSPSTTFQQSLSCAVPRMLLPNIVTDVNGIANFGADLCQKDENGLLKECMLTIESTK